MEAAKDHMSVGKDTADRLLKFSGEAYAGVPTIHTNAYYQKLESIDVASLALIAR